MQQRPCFIFAGGGTGGHLFPGLAIAERLRDRAPTTRLVFACSDRPLDASVLGEAGVEFTPLPARPMLIRPFPIGIIGLMHGWFGATKAARRLIRSMADECGGSPSTIVHVVAMGGYVAAPVTRAAHSVGTPVTLINLDVVPGKANRLTARWATRVLSAVECVGSPWPKRCGAVEVVGMPVRRAAVADSPPTECRRRLGLAPDEPTLLITGASQGAGTFNELMIRLCETRPESLRGWQFIHLTGAKDEEFVRRAYADAGLHAAVMAFHALMGDIWGAATLALSRAGASSVAEAQLNGIPTVFAPYPWHADEHQWHNARFLVECGGAWLVEDRIEVSQNLERMGRMLLDLMAHPDRIAGAGKALARKGHIDAADRIASALLDFHTGR